MALACGLTPEQVGVLLGADAGRLLTETRVRKQEFTEADIVAVLRQVAGALGSPLSADRYDTVCDEFGGPSSARIIQRFGSWNAACEAAGLATNRGRSNYARGWTRERVLHVVADYLAAESSTGSYAGYAAWARQTPGAPSAQTMRNYLGTWSTAKAEALAVLARRG